MFVLQSTVYSLHRLKTRHMLYRWNQENVTFREKNEFPNEYMWYEPFNAFSTQRHETIIILFYFCFFLSVMRTVVFSFVVASHIESTSNDSSSHLLISQFCVYDKFKQFRLMTNKINSHHSPWLWTIVIFGKFIICDKRYELGT